MTKQPNNPQFGKDGQARQQHQAGGQSDMPRQQQQFEAKDESRIAAQIHARMEVIGADGAHVGKVDRVVGDRLRLSPDDWKGSERGTAHYLPLDQVSAIEGDCVRLTLNAERATSVATTI